MFGALAIGTILMLPVIATARTMRGIVVGFFTFALLSVFALAQALSALVGTWPGFLSIAPALDLGGTSALIALPVIAFINAFIWLGPVATACLWGAFGLWAAAMATSTEYLVILHLIDRLRRR